MTNPVAGSPSGGAVSIGTVEQCADGVERVHGAIDHADDEILARGSVNGHGVELFLAGGAQAREPGQQDAGQADRVDAKR